MIKRTTIETIEEYDSNGKLIKKTTTETREEDESGLTTYPSNIPQPNPYWNPSITWDSTTPHPIRYDQITCDCNMPDDCASCNAGCKQ